MLPALTFSLQHAASYRRKTSQSGPRAAAMPRAGACRQSSQLFFYQSQFDWPHGELTTARPGTSIPLGRGKTHTVGKKLVLLRHGGTAGKYSVVSPTRSCISLSHARGLVP